MIRLKNGVEIEYDQNFDVFFQRLLSTIISESAAAVSGREDAPSDKTAYNKALAKEIMDNSIFVTHQIFEIEKLNANLAKFLVTGFLFNSIVLSIPDMSDDLSPEPAPENHLIH